MNGYVYTLSCPLNGDIFYVGCTKDELHVRLGSHLNKSKSSQSAVHLYIRSNNIIPAIDLLEVVEYESRNSLLDREEYWIDQLRQWGYKLKNKLSTTPKKIIRNPLGSGSLKIDSKILKASKEYCKRNRILLNQFATEAIKEKLKKVKKTSK